MSRDSNQAIRVDTFNSADNVLEDIEAQLERVSEACLSVSQFADNLSHVNDKIVHFESKLSENNQKVADITQLIGIMQTLADKSNIDVNTNMQKINSRMNECSEECENTRVEIQSSLAKVNNQWRDHIDVKTEKVRVFVQAQLHEQANRYEKMLLEQRNYYDAKLLAMQTKMDNIERHQTTHMQNIVQQTHIFQNQVDENLASLHKKSNTQEEQMTHFIQITDKLRKEARETEADLERGKESTKICMTKNEEIEIQLKNLNQLLQKEMKAQNSTCLRISQDIVSRVDSQQQIFNQKIATLEESLQKENKVNAESVNKCVASINRNRLRVALQDEELTDTNIIEEPQADDIHTLRNTIANLEELMKTMQYLEGSIIQKKETTASKKVKKTKKKVSQQNRQTSSSSLSSSNMRKDEEPLRWKR